MGLRLRELREKRGLTPRQMTERLGVKEDRYRKWENGVNGMPLEYALEACSILRCSLDELASALPERWPLTHDGAGGWQPQARLNRSWHGAHPFRNLRNAWQTWMRYDLRAPRWLTEKLMGHAAGDVSDMYYDRPDAARLGEMMADLYRDRPIWD